MNTSEKSALRAKYNRTQSIHDVKFSDTAKDMNKILDSLPDSPLSKSLRVKYSISRDEHTMYFWIAADDVNAMLDLVSPVDVAADADGKAVTP